MIRIERRPLTAEETERLRAAAGSLPADDGGAGPQRDWVGGGFGVGVAGLLLAGGGRWYVALALGALVWRMAVVARRRRREAAELFVRASAAVYERDLAGGEAEVMHVEATEVVARVERPDEPPAFVFDVGGGELLALSDPALAAAVGEGSFPCAEFDVVVAPESGALLGIQASGPALAPIRTEDFELYGSPQLFDGTLAEIGGDG